jgi:gliding motility-associated protein GldL
MAKLYGFGAAVVIIGAMFKIQHWPGAGPMLIVGLSTEAVIFAFSAFEPLHEDPDWTLVYPQLAVPEDEEAHASIEEHIEEEHKPEEELPLTEQLDKMLEEAKIGPELIESLGSGLMSLRDQAAKLNDITDASVATNEFTNSVRGASESASKLSQSYSQSSEAINSSAQELSKSYITTAEAIRSQVSSEGGSSYNEQLQNVTKNLSALNSVYELQLQNSTSYVESTNHLYSGIQQLLQNLNESVEDTKRYKDNIAELSENLSSLNTIYGNMLSAMNFRK